MKYLSMLVLIMVLAFVAASAGAEEPRMASTGTYQHVVEEHDQLVVDDHIYALEKTVWVDGTKYPIDQLKELLDEGDTVSLELSRKSRDGRVIVTRIRTNP